MENRKNRFETGQIVSAGIYLCTNCTGKIEMAKKGQLGNCPNLNSGIPHNEPNTFNKLGKFSG